MRKMKDSGIEWIGEIPEGWDIGKIKYTGDYKSGSCINAQLISEDGDFPVYGGNGIRGYTNMTTHKGEHVLIGRQGALCGNVQYVNREFWASEHAIVATVYNTFYVKFVYYCLYSMNLNQYSESAAQPGLSVDRIVNLSIAFPKELKEQQQIASYLDHKCAEIDSVIKAKETTNEKLKEYRQSIIYEAVTKGIDKNVPMKDSGIEWIGEIPEGWGFCKLKYDAYMKGRIGWQGLKASEFTDEGPYLVTGTDFFNGKINWDLCYHISDERYLEAPEIHLKEYDLLITKDGTIGKLAYIDYLPNKASLNSHLLVIRSVTNRFINKYLYWVLSSKVFTFYSELAQDGTIMASLSQQKIGEFVFAAPTYIEQHQIVNYLDRKCAEIDSVISANQKTIEKLKEYRQSIIYEAVTGKIEI